VACINRAKSIPENATLRKEYIKCGKRICLQRHGPYYYAYWKDPESKKLKKKYIGDHIPQNKKSNNDRNSSNHIVRDILLINGVIRNITKPDTVGLYSVSLLFSFESNSVSTMDCSATLYRCIHAYMYLVKSSYSSQYT
jgi:hypothetical protein